MDDKIFCVHGGLSPSLRSKQQITEHRRPCDVPDVGLICDFLWADPDACTQGWAESERGVSYTFGADVVSKFLEDHDFDLMVRAHQVVEDGYEFFAQRQLVTLFSAPNYCGEFDNSGAVMSVDASLMCSFHILKPRSAAPGTPDTVGRGARGEPRAPVSIEFNRSVPPGSFTLASGSRQPKTRPRARLRAAR